LKEKGMYEKIADVVEELRVRDERDSSRAVAPLRHYPDAIFLDTTEVPAAEAARRIVGWWQERGENPRVSGG